MRGAVRRIGRFMHKALTDSGSVEVAEQDGVRTLHLGNATIQSAMRVSAPYDLELAYTRGMMTFLLFKPEPRDVLVLGLGGGSLPKFIRRYMEGVHVKVVEIDPQVVAVARNHFFLQEDDEYLQVLAGDGAEYVRTHHAACDVLLADAFDSSGAAPELCSQDFYDACAATLVSSGIFVANLWGSDKNFDTYLQRIGRAFEGRVLMMPTGKPGNIVVFGFRREPGDLRWKTLREHAKALQQRYRIDFLEFVERLRDNNSNTTSRVLGF
jgi:spermidine synthase